MSHVTVCFLLPVLSDQPTVRGQRERNIATGTKKDVEGICKKKKYMGYLTPFGDYLKC
jgi:hypothetical protein